MLDFDEPEEGPEGEGHVQWHEHRQPDGPGKRWPEDAREWTPLSVQVGVESAEVRQERRKPGEERVQALNHPQGEGQAESDPEQPAPEDRSARFRHRQRYLHDGKGEPLLLDPSSPQKDIQGQDK